MPVQLVSGVQMITLHAQPLSHVAHGRDLVLSHLLFRSGCLLTQGKVCVPPLQERATVVSTDARQKP